MSDRQDLLDDEARLFSETDVTVLGEEVHPLRMHPVSMANESLNGQKGGGVRSGVSKQQAVVVTDRANTVRLQPAGPQSAAFLREAQMKTARSVGKAATEVANLAGIFN